MNPYEEERELQRAADEAELARVLKEGVLEPDPLEFKPPPRLSDDHEPDLYEGRYRAWQDEQEARYVLSGPNSEERRDNGEFQ